VVPLFRTITYLAGWPMLLLCCANARQENEELQVFLLTSLKVSDKDRAATSGGNVASGGN
jgi:hypothetical protein